MENDIARSLVKILYSNDVTNTAGTGFFITPDGYILTCYHVIENLKEVWLTWEGMAEPVLAEFYPKLCDKTIDYALLKVPLIVGNVLPLGIAWESGDEVYSKGYQYEHKGFKDFPARGSIIDMTEKDNCPLLVLEDATNIQPGISGAPALNKRTEQVIGVITAKWEEKNTGFIVPIEEIARNILSRPDIHESLLSLFKPLRTSPEQLQENFRDELIELYELIRYEVEQPRGFKDFFLITESRPGRRRKTKSLVGYHCISQELMGESIIKDFMWDSKEVIKDYGIQDVTFISNRNPDTKAILIAEKEDIELLTYAELLDSLIDFKPYFNRFIEDMKNDQAHLLETYINGCRYFRTTLLK